MSDSIRVAVIMAGGSGERFWPLSREQRPKQLLKLTGSDENLLQEAVSRVLPLVPAENVFLATSRTLCNVICAGDERIPNANVLAEPCRRNTAGCLIWAAANLIARYGEDQEVTMAILTADHRIGAHDKFRATLDAAMSAAEKQSALVTIGATPERADTGYGYIEILPNERQNNNNKTTGIYPVHRFREKPNQSTADEFVASGNFLWNCGMFFWRVSTFLDELGNAQPEMAATARLIAKALAAGEEAEAVRLFEGLESISIDYALLEHAHNVLVAESTFPWDDVGSWDSLDRTREPDPRGNVTHGDPVLVDVENSIVFNEAGPDKMAVALVGVEDVVVVTVDDAVLVVAKDRVQDVKKVVAELQKRKGSQL